MKRIFLIGYMGSGKTTIGKLLADKLDYSFVDMDVHIEQKYFKTISQIFAEKGEDKFRLIEQQCLHEVSEFEHVVISTGGGAPCFFDNMDFMNKHGMTVYLELTPAELAERLESIQGNKRPLLAGRKGNDLRHFIAEGLAARHPYYALANYSVSGDVESTVLQIYDLIQKSPKH